MEMHFGDKQILVVVNKRNHPTSARCTHIQCNMHNMSAMFKFGAQCLRAKRVEKMNIFRCHHIHHSDSVNGTTDTTRVQSFSFQRRRFDLTNGASIVANDLDTVHVVDQHKKRRSLHNDKHDCGQFERHNVWRAHRLQLINIALSTASHNQMLSVDRKISDNVCKLQCVVNRLKIAARNILHQHLIWLRQLHKILSMQLTAIRHMAKGNMTVRTT
mmetsp:Transcript_12746/g.19332  ORF Transcript_12746/g.19332 Transcript_12746/m.19332 type:complete len:215 (-) Transcript_12746:33-677(-)